MGYKDTLPKISFNYLGKFQKEKNAWNIVDEVSPTTVDPKNNDYMDLIINCLIIEEKLKFT